MTTYNTYQEAKIANPECEIFHVNGICFFNYEALASDICNPADHCMTVEKFLADGHKFVEGDLILDEGVTWTVSDKVNSDTYIYTVKSSNKPDIDDNERYILRAAALEDKKPRTKVEYVKCEFSHAWVAVRDFEEGRKLYTKRSHKDYILIDNAPDVLRFLYDLHERIETSITEREEFIEQVSKCLLNANDPMNPGGILFDSGKFKLVNQDSDLLRSKIRAVAEWEINTSNNHDWESVAESIYCAVDDLLKS